MSAFRLLPLIVGLLLTFGRSAHAQGDRSVRSTDRVGQRVQQRIDSLRRAMATQPDETQAYHDSVLHYLQTRGMDPLQRRIDSLRQAPSVKQDRAHVYHDSVLHYLQARSDGTVQRSSSLSSAPPVRRERVSERTPPSKASPSKPLSEASIAQDPANTPPPTSTLSSRPSSVQSSAPNPQTNDRRTELTAQPLPEAATRSAESLRAPPADTAQAAPLSAQERYQQAAALKKEAWAAHLQLGSYFHLYRQPQVSVDISPFMGYRFNARWSMGVGVSYRVPASLPLYQGRIFAEGIVYQGVLLHAEYERSWQPQPGDLGQSIITTHHPLAGVGITYRITQKMRGATLLLFRPDSQSPSLDLARWNLRTGIYLGQ